MHKNREWYKSFRLCDLLDVNNMSNNILITCSELVDNSTADNSCKKDGIFPHLAYGLPTSVKVDTESDRGGKYQQLR